VCYPGNAGGIGFCKNAQGGRLATSMLWSIPRMPLASFLGGKTSAGTWGFGFPTAPDLCLFMMGYNDNTAGASSDAICHAITAVFTACRRGKPNASLILMASWSPSLNGDAAGTLNQLLWGQKVQAMRGVAEDLGAAFVNINARWGETQVARGFGGSVHPNDAGHADIAAAILSIL
jgi:hypothetical protein